MVGVVVAAESFDVGEDLPARTERGREDRTAQGGQSRVSATAREAALPPKRWGSVASRAPSLTARETHVVVGRLRGASIAST
jgi:hypothetical protein